MPQFPVTYPDQLPVASVSLAVAIVREGSAVARKAELGLALWNVQGYLQRVSLGVPNGEAEFASLACGDETELLVELNGACEGALVQLGPTEAHDAMGDAEVSMDPATILLVVKSVMELIALWRNRR